MIVELDEPSTYVLQRLPGGRVSLRLFQTELPAGPGAQPGRHRVPGPGEGRQLVPRPRRPRQRAHRRRHGRGRPQHRARRRPPAGGARTASGRFKKGAVRRALRDEHLPAAPAGRLLHRAAGAGAADAGRPGGRRRRRRRSMRPGAEQAPLHRPPHRPRLQGRRHPQHPAPAGRRRRRQHRHLRRRQGRGHHQDARRPLGPGAGRGPAPEAAGPGARGQPDPRGAAGGAGEGAGAGDRPAEADHRGAADRDPPDRRVLRRRQEPASTAPRTCCRRGARSRSTSAPTP